MSSPKDFKFIADLESNPKEIYLETTTIILKLIENVIKHPQESKYRTLKLTNPIVVNKLLPVIGAMECLFAIGFSEGDDNLYLPPEASLENLTLIKDKISARREEVLKKLANESTIYNACNINLTTQIPLVTLAEKDSQRAGNLFLKQIENYFNFVLVYEREDLQNKALKLIPTAELEHLAEKRMRTLKNTEKNNELKLGKQDFILVELMNWFKNTFFKWIDSPSCQYCKNNTKFSHNEYDNGQRVEVFSCVRCKRATRFQRINDPGRLLETRRGRCGEWANCFTLCCRALGWDARWVVDINDHVWTEVYSKSQRRWLHCDPCENICDTPLIYEIGWHKPMRYVMAYSCHDVQDVTWRYSCDHEAVRARRTLCDERELLATIIRLRAKRQQSLLKWRQDELNERLVRELVEFMTPRKPEDADHRGRSSGSLAWRLGRDEAPDDALHQPYCWVPTQPERLAGAMQIRYSCVRDVYIRPLAGNKELSGWRNGVAKTDSVFRKEEKDWNIVYLARTEGAEHGLVTWKFDLTAAGLVIDVVKVRCHARIFNSAKVSWLLCSGNTCVRVPYDNTTLISEDFRGLSQLTLSAHLTGSEGPQAWQHAQLFRTSTKNASSDPDLDENTIRILDGEDASSYQMDVTVTLTPRVGGTE